MKRLILILSSLLVLQLLLTASLFLNQEYNTGAFKSEKKMIGLELSAIDNIEIASPGEQTLIFSKIENRWVMPEYYGVNASNKKMADITDKLFNLKRSWPVAITESSAPRFKVSTDKYEHKITFKNQNKTLETLFLGSSPGFRKVHARLDGHHEIYAIAFNTYEISGKPDDWVEKGLLNINQDEIVQVKLKSLSLNKKEGQWTLEGIAENEELDRNSVKSLIAKLSNLTFKNLLGTEDKPKYQLENPVFSFDLTMGNGHVINYQFGKPENTDNFIAKSSVHPYYFKISKNVLEPIMQTEKANLITEKSSNADDT